jgi:hypothetical protein
MRLVICCMVCGEIISVKNELRTYDIFFGSCLGSCGICDCVTHFFLLDFDLNVQECDATKA